MQDRAARIRRSALAAFLISVAGASASLAQDAAAEPPNVDLLRDFIHYTRIARYDLAKSYASALLDRGLTPAEFVKLVEDSGEFQRFEETALRAARVADLESVAGALLKTYENGKLAQVRDAAEISRNIGMLTGTARQSLLARERLAEAGEYAVPQLLEGLLRRTDPSLQAAIHMQLVSMGRQSVAPLSEALLRLDPAGQETVVRVLADIPYRASLPAIAEVMQSSPSQNVKAACEAALSKIAQAPAAAPAPLYRELAEEYYREADSLTSFPAEEVQLLWTFDPATGLSATPIATPVFHEAMAMRSAERALRLDASDADSLSLWLASNFSREIDSPENYENPVYPATRRDAMYYAVAAGAAANQRVLDRALSTSDTPLARRAIAAIRRTAGSASIVADASAPITAALGYPNRRVQYEAALAIGAAQPLSSFTGSERVVPILGSAVRDASTRFAAVLAADTERQQSLADTLRAAGYTILPPGRSLDEIDAAIAESPGVDLIVLDLPQGQTLETVSAVRGRSDLSAAPVLALTSQAAYADTATSFDRDPLTRVAREGLSPDQLRAASQQLVDGVTGGSVSESEAAEYQSAALAVLRDLAVSRNAALNVSDAARPLIASLERTKGELRLKIADVLANVPDAAAQQALVESALAASGDEQISLLNAAGESARRFGNQSSESQVGRLVKLAASGEGETGTAAGGLVGALGVTNESLIPLILGSKK